MYIKYIEEKGRKNDEISLNLITHFFFVKTLSHKTFEKIPCLNISYWVKQIHLEAFYVSFK